VVPRAVALPGSLPILTAFWEWDVTSPPGA